MTSIGLHSFPTPPLSGCATSGRATSGERTLVVALVVAAHCAVLLAWAMRPEPPRIAVDELSVSVAMRQAEVVQEAAVPLPVQAPLRSERVREPQPVESPMARPQEMQQTRQEPEPSAGPQSTRQDAAAPVTDTAPDYRAAYLSNPRPAYPMVARRMGWEGRVVLNVEVLAEGSCGDINIAQGSGHEVLDNAALRTVKGWRFVPATRAGQAITQWFKVPIQFSLKENEA